MNKITTVTVNKTLLDQIVRYCIDKKPHEACGFLIGSSGTGTIEVFKFVPVPNAAGNPAVRFTMDPADLIPIVASSSYGNFSIIGLIHSHPTAAAIPSAEDLRTAWSHIPSHWIISLQKEDEYDLQVYSYLNPANQAIGSSDCFSQGYTPLRLIITEAKKKPSD